MAKKRKAGETLSFDSELTKLREAFAQTQFRDELKRRSKGHPKARTPLMVRKLLDIRFRIDGTKNHSRPHIHVDYGKNHRAASFAIDNGERLAGKLNRKYDRPASEWIERNKKQLKQAWDLVMSSGNTDLIVAELRIAP